MKLICRTECNIEILSSLLGSGGDEVDPDPVVMVIDLDDETGGQILERIGMFEVVKHTDSQASELRFWNYSFECFGDHDLDGYEDSPFEGFKILPEGAESEWAQSRIEMQELTILPGGTIRFSCVPKHCDTPVLSPSIDNFEEVFRTHLVH
jgi:hypothetical protein